MSSYTVELSSGRAQIAQTGDARRRVTPATVPTLTLAEARSARRAALSTLARRDLRRDHRRAIATVLLALDQKLGLNRPPDAAGAGSKVRRDLPLSDRVDQANKALYGDPEGERQRAREIARDLWGGRS
jgi:hypothetical protein